MKKIASLLTLFFALKLLAGTPSTGSTNIFSNLNVFSNSGAAYGFDTTGKFTMNNPYSLPFPSGWTMGTNGHYRGVDQFGNIREWTTNRFTVQTSVGGVSKTLLFSNNTLSVDGAAVLTNGATLSGNGGGLTNLQAITTNSAFYFNKAIQGAASGAMQRPWIFLYNSPYIIGANPPEGEARILTNLLLMATSGDFARITNGGEQFAYYFDVGWDMGRVSQQGTNLLYNCNYVNWNWSTLLWNTNTYPHGLPWIINVLHSNNIKCVAQFYGTPRLMQAGADELICSPQGIDIRYWTNGVGTWPTNTFGRYVTMWTPETAKHDVSELMRWGFDGYVDADSNQTLAQVQDLDLEYGNDAMRVSIPVGYNNPYSFGFTVPVTNYYAVNTNLFTTNSPGVYLDDFPAMEAFGKPMVYIAYQSVSSGFQDHTLGYMTSANHAGAYYDNSGQGSAATGLDNVLRDFPTTRYANQGAYVFWVSGGGGDFGPVAITHALPVMGLTNNAILNSYPTYLNMITNVSWQLIHNDPLQAWPVRSDTLLGTNYGTVYYEPLWDGDRAVWFANKTNNASYLNISWEQLGWASNLNVQVVNITTTGNVTNGVFTNNFYLGLASQNVGLYRFTPLAPIQIGGQLGLGNIATLNTNGTKPLVITEWSTTSGGPIVVTHGQPYSGSGYDSNVVFAAYGAGNFGGSGYATEGMMQLQTDNNTTFGAVWELNRDNSTAVYWNALAVKNGSTPTVTLDTSTLGTRIWGGLTASNGITSLSSNLAAPFGITFPATTVNWTNTTGKNIFVFIDNTAVTGTSVKLNGTTIFSGLSLDLIIPLQPGEYFSETYAAGTPSATIKPQ